VLGVAYGGRKQDVADPRRSSFTDSRRGVHALQLLLEEIGAIGAQSGLRKLAARIVTGRADIIRALERAGFRSVAVLKEYVKDATGKYADLAILVRELPGGPAART